MAYILENAVQKFLDPAIPAWGPYEEELDPPLRPQEPDGLTYPGGGLARHDMIFIGEGCNRIFLVKDGKVVWTYDTGAGWELDDVWMLSNGNILFSRMYWAAMVTPDKKQVWRMEAPEHTEIHTLQPLDRNRAAMVINKDREPHLLIVNLATGDVESDRTMPYIGAPGTHGQNRRFRVTAQGTYLMPYLTGGEPHCGGRQDGIHARRGLQSGRLPARRADPLGSTGGGADLTAGETAKNRRSFPSVRWENRPAYGIILSAAEKIHPVKNKIL